ncbi:MAG TPA: GAF domain-containing protein [Myxococcota bacterium]|nr:GAF domain-containing protein [Myxococcota bacterium]
MRKRIGIYGASDEALALIPLLSANPAIEIACIVDPDALRLLDRLPQLEPGVAALLEQTLTNDAQALAGDASLHAVIDAGGGPPFAERFPAAIERGVQAVSPLTARLLWGLGVPSQDRKVELLQALHEVVDSYNLTVDTDELFVRMLEIAIGATGADGGSLMLVDESGSELAVRVAVGVERELWPKIRVPFGEGIAGRVAAEGRSLRLRGKADRQRFRILRERLDVESAMSVPLLHDGRVLGVLNLHHRARVDAFSDADLAFTEDLARLDAQIIARAQQHEALAHKAERYAAAQEVGAILGGREPLPDRLRRLCDWLAARSGGGIATIYQVERAAGGLRLVATSLAGGHLGGEYRVAPGRGIDGQVAQTRKPAFLRQPDGAVAYAALPLADGGELVGVLSIQCGSKPPRGRAAEETLLEIAATAARKIADAEREVRLAARAHLAGAVNEAGIRMITTTDPAELLRLGTSSAAMVLEADHAVLRLQDEDTQRFAIRSYFGSADGPLQERLFRLDKDVSVDVLRRRAPLLERDLAADPRRSAHGTEVRSLLAAPLRRDGQLVGTLALYDKIAADRFTAGAFDEDDAALFAQFSSYFERAIANAVFYDKARRFRNFDEDTGLPNAAYLAQRIREEAARAGTRDGAFAVAVVRIANFAEVEAAGDPVKTRRGIHLVVEALRRNAREFDVLTRCENAEFALLMPDPGHDPAQRVLDLARTVSEDVTRDERVNTPQRIALAFGYAIHGKDGHDAQTLLARARDPRIHMV